MKIIIVDDDKKAAALLGEKLRGYEGAEVAGIAHNGMDGLRLLADTHPDLLFLDVELPDISGIEFLERIDGCARGRCRVVMYSAHSRYMLRAFRNKAFDYLLKPIDDRELGTIIRRACIETARDHTLPHPNTAQGDAHATTSEALDSDGIARRSDGKYIVYTNAMDFRLVDIRDIGVFTYNHDLRVWEVTISGQDEPIRLKRSVNSDTITDLSETLVRVSQKHIINLGYLMEVADNTCRFYPPFDGIEDVKVGRFFRKKLIDRFSSL